MTFLGWCLSLLGYALTWSLLPIVLLRKKRNPAASIAWMLTIVLLPIGGAVLFLLFGVNRVERRKRTRKISTQQLASQRPFVAPSERPPQPDDPPAMGRLLRLAHRVADGWPTRGNAVELLNDTHHTLALIEQAITAANESIHLEYYIWQPDRTGTQLRDLLIGKAKQGVRVRFLYDGFGSSRLKQRFLQPMRDAGILVATFLPGQTLRERWSINLRNHRKIVVVDDRVAFTGGMNIGDEYLGRDREIGFWRDTHLRLEGPEVQRHQAIFAEDWYYATGEVLSDTAATTSAGNVTAQTVSDGPITDTSVFQALMLAAINEAERDLHLATSYFAPPHTIVIALQNAAFRGVRVRLLVSGRKNHPMPLLAGRAVYDDLLQAGCEIWEYERGLLHSKTLTIDGHWSLVGSPNLDCRSLFLNFESGVILYDAAIAAQLQQQFARDAQDARLIDVDSWSRRGWVQHVAESFCRLFTPLL